MKIRYTVVLLLLTASPALAAATKTVGDVSFECKLTGSGDSGFDITTETKVAKTCSAACKLTKKDGRTQQWTYQKRKVNTGKTWFGGESSVSGSPLSKPDLTSASCS
jgi:hypothetical protein